MKKIIRTVFILMGAVMITSCKSNETIEIFNGENLDNWVIFINDQDVDPSSVFNVADGVINVTGKPNGYIRTKDSYSNYKLHVEWRWLEEPGNSGILFHARGKDKLWPNSVECQLMAGHAGDIILVGSGAGITVKDSTYLVVPEITGNIWLYKFEESSEHQAGEWNAAEIISTGDSLEIVINGIIQHLGTGMTMTEGSILLQSEGAPMQFRNINLVPLD